MGRMSIDPTLEVVPLGGLGEFGMHIMAFRAAGSIIVVDCGVLFPEPELLGIDIVVPDVAYLLERRDEVRAIVLTHGHEDHIGALPFVLPYLNVPVYGSRFTLGLVRDKLRRHGLLESVTLHEVAPKQKEQLGAFTVEFIQVTHSIVDSFALAIQTPAGVVIHTGDFKVDPSPVDGKPFDLASLAAYGDRGVLALFSDSTNAESSGYTLSERAVEERFDAIFRSAAGRILISCSTSSIPRLQIILDQASKRGRSVSFLGRRLNTTTEIARQLGLLHVPPGLLIRPKDIRNHPREQLCVVAGGCQGEPMSALSQVALDRHKDLAIDPGDTVVLSSRIIPGNERAISRMIDHFYRRDAELYYQDGRLPPIHVSGHASREELKLMMALVRPQFFIPIHGAYRQLRHHARLAEQTGAVREKVIAAETGDIIRFEAGGAAIAGKAPVGRILIDEGSLEEVEEIVIRDRRHISEDGIVIPVIAIDKQTGAMETPPEIAFRGIALDTDSDLAETRQLIVDTINASSIEERADGAVIKEKIRNDLKRFMFRQTSKRPFILPVILEL